MTPLLFMGDEWAATTPFLYFTDHEPELGALVSNGRRREFERFPVFAGAGATEKIPDPQARATFECSKLCWDEREHGEHARTLALFRAALALRRDDAVLSAASNGHLAASAVGDVLVVQRWLEDERRLLLANFGARPQPLAELTAYRELAEVRCLLASGEPPGDGLLAPWSSALFGGSATAPERSRHG